MIASTLFAKLPEDVVTPDGMAIDREGNLILACPNYADQSKAGCILKIKNQNNIQKWFDVPVHEQTGVARPMGIAFGEDGDLYICDNQGWTGKSEHIRKGRILRVRMDGNRIVQTTVVAKNMEHPNGIRIKNGYLFVTQSTMELVKHPSGKLVSCVYRFRTDDREIDVGNTLSDEHICATFLTYNPDNQYGVDGITFDADGNLLVGNFGDGAVYKLELDEDMSVKSNTLWVQDAKRLKSTDGMVTDAQGNVYVADFCANAIDKIQPDKTVSVLSQNGDTDGQNGELDQPGEPILWNNKLIVSCFDCVVNDQVVNTAHELPATLAQIEL